MSSQSLMFSSTPKWGTAFCVLRVPHKMALHGPHVPRDRVPAPESGFLFLGGLKLALGSPAPIFDEFVKQSVKEIQCFFSGFLFYFRRCLRLCRRQATLVAAQDGGGPTSINGIDLDALTSGYVVGLACGLAVALLLILNLKSDTLQVTHCKVHVTRYQRVRPLPPRGDDRARVKFARAGHPPRRLACSL